MIQGIIEILKSSTAVTSLVGQNASGDKPKIYPVICPQSEETKYITVHETSLPPIRCKDGITDYNFSVNVICYGEKYGDINEMANAVISALDSRKLTAAGVTFKNLIYDTRQDGYDPEAKKYLKIVQFSGQCGFDS